MAKKFVGLDGLKHFWTKAKTWITAQITSEVTARITELVANAPEDLDTLKEIADWISAHADSASAMNTAIQNNAKAISDEATARANADSALQTAIDGKASSSHTHDDRYYTESEVDTKLSGKANIVSNGYMSGVDVTGIQGAGVLLKDEITRTVWNVHTHGDNLRLYNGSTEKVLSENGHTHTKSQITDFPSGLPPKFENNTWYLVGDDVKIGDHNIAGALGLLGDNGNTRLDFCQYGNPSNYKSITFDGSTLYMDGKASTAGSADTATKATQDGNGNVITSTYATKSEVLQQFDHIVDSNETLLEWANCTNRSMKNVLVKSGTYTLNGSYINLENAGTTYVFGEVGNKLEFTNANYGIFNSDTAREVRITGLNVDVIGDNASTAFINCNNLINCTGYALSGSGSVAFYNCNNLINCTASAGGNGVNYGFNQCNRISNCYATVTSTITNSSTSLFVAAYYQCNRINNSEGYATNFNSAYGFLECNYLNNCTGEATTTNTSTDSPILACGFRRCKLVIGCTSNGRRTGSYSRGWCFYGCNVVSNCCASGEGFSDGFITNTSNYSDVIGQGIAGLQVI